MKGRKLLITVVALLLIIFVIMVVYLAQRETMGRKAGIQIGAVLPLTGELSFFGQGDRKALQLFASQNPGVEFIFEDSKGTAKDGLNATTKLLSADIKYFITSISYIVNTVQPALDRRKALNFTLNMDPRSEEKSRYCLRLYVTFYDEMDKFISLVREKGFKRTGVLYVNVESMRNAIENYLRPKLKAMDVELSTESYEIGTKDFRQLLLKLDSTRPEIIRIMDFGDKLNVILKQIDEAKLFPNAPIVSGIETLLSDITIYPHNIADRFLFTSPKFLLDDRNGVVQAYKELYKENPSYDAMFAYDIANILTPLIRKHGYDNAEKVIDEIEKMGSFTGVAAEYTVNSSGGVSPKIYWAIIKDSKIVFR